MRAIGVPVMAWTALTAACAPAPSVPPRFFFSANDGVHGAELWTSDGTPEGTILVKDAVPGAASSSPRQITAAPGGAYFVGTAAGRSQLWWTDGTEAGTRLVKELAGGFSRLTAAGTRLFFAGNDRTHGSELWISDGTDVGTRLVVDLTPGASSSTIEQIVALGRDVLFSARVGSEHVFLRSDGTEGGTAEVRRFSEELVAVSHPRTVLLFGPHDLLRTDGTSAGTVTIEAFNRLRTVEPYRTVAGDRAFFFVRYSLRYGDYNTDLWRTDGTPEGTEIVRGFGEAGVPHPGTGQPAFPHPWSLSALGRDAVFAASYQQVWKTDGSAAGTVPLFTIDGGNLHEFAGGPRRAFFKRWMSEGAYRAPGSVEYEELWTTDGTSEGTRRLQRFRTLKEMHEVGGRLFVIASDASPTAADLWTSDGTAEGTVLLRTFP
jgi:ELWxxDGT repeat protein